MIKILASLLLGLVIMVTSGQMVYGDVWIPEHEYVGFFDSNGIYQVVGAIKNSENYPVIPTITISIQDGNDVFSKDFEYVNIRPGHEMPFKFAFPEVQSREPVLYDAEISFIRGIHQDYSIKVMYDETLKIHPDGHITGRIINTGQDIVTDVRLLAIIHGFDHEVLDMGQNITPINEIKPGEIMHFEMFPDFAVQRDVWYYSCFALGDLSVITLNAQRNDEIYTIRYDSSALISYPEFDEAGENLSFYLNPGWPMQTSVNFEFPRYSNDEHFEVFLNDEKIESIQSIDEMGNWHVAFTIDDQAYGDLIVRGFDPDAMPTLATLIPDWVRNNAGWWSQGKISDDDFLSGIQFLIKQKLILVDDSSSAKTSDAIPDWVRNNAGWWSQGNISDQDFLSGIEFLISKGIIST